MPDQKAQRRLIRFAFVLLINFATYTFATVPASASVMGCSGNEEACGEVGFGGCCENSCECESNGSGYEICICPCC